MPFNHFAVIAYALVVVALCSLVMTLRAFGFWRWLEYAWADHKAWLFDAEEDDEPYVHLDPEFYGEATPPIDPDPPSPDPYVYRHTEKPKRKRRTKKDAK
jgi:hypothetical protein